MMNELSGETECPIDATTRFKMGSHLTISGLEALEGLWNFHWPGKPQRSVLWVWVSPGPKGRSTSTVG